MSDFALSFHRLQADRMDSTVWTLVAAIAVLVGWVCWAMFVRV
jgi:hypothetical protein